MSRILDNFTEKVISCKFMRIRPNNLLRHVPPIWVTWEMTRILYNFTEKVISCKFMRIRPNNLLRRVPPIRVTRQMTRILDNLTEKSDLFKIYPNLAQHFVKTHLAYKGNTANDKNTGQFYRKK